MKANDIIPTESQEQIMLFQWAEYQKKSCPELALMFHIPNGGARYIATAKRLKAEGVKSGVPDVFLAVPKNGHHGLFIEMKRQKKGVLSDDQSHWLNALKQQGYAVCVCKGFEDAKTQIMKYLKGESLPVTTS